MRWALLLVMAAGCRQIFGLDSPSTTADARGDGVVPIDGPRDAQGGTCIDRWMMGPQFAQATPLTGVNTGTQDRYPFVTADGLTLYYVHDADYFIATRPDQASAFGAGMKETMLSSGNGDAKIYVSDDQTRAFFASNRNGGSGGTDIWRAHRALASDPWQLDQTQLENINAGGDQVDPTLSPDLLQIYFAMKGGAGGNHIHAAVRLTASMSFNLPTMVSGLASSDNDDQPTLTADGRVIVFTSTRNGNFDLWYATRDDATTNFGTPKALTSLNLSQKVDSGPFITADGCQLYFMSDRNGSFDLYTTALLD